MQINPFDFFTDTAGDALDAGYIWIGQPNLDPRQYPITAFYDAALTIPAAMPLRTSNGYIVRNGTPTFLYIDGNYSIRVEDKNHRQIYYVPDFLMIGNDSAVSLSYLQSYAVPIADLKNFTDPAKGSDLVGWTRAPIKSDITTVHKALDGSMVNIWEFVDLITNKPNPTDPTTWDFSPALNGALASNGSVYCPGPTTYHVQNIRMYAGRQIISDRSATFLPVSSGITMFYCDDDVVTAREFSISGLIVRNTELKTDVTVFNFPQARRDVLINDCYINGGGRANNWVGVSWPKLNWMTRTLGVQVESCLTGFRFRNAAAVMDLLQCVALDCGVGFDAAFVGGDADILNRISIRGGVCQSNDVGIKLRNTDAVVIDSVHFENNTFDIDSDGDKNLMIFAPEMRGNNVGLTSVGIKLRNTLGVTIYKPITAGVRQSGFFQVDTSNFLVSLDIDIRLDSPTLNSTMLSTPGDLSGLNYVQNISNFRSLSGLVLDMNSPISTYQKTVPDGGVVITATSPVDGREAMVSLRPNSSYTTGAIMVLGYSVDVTGGIAIRNKNKTLRFIYRTSVGGWLMISESTGWQ
jgi:hypothetical protein